MNKKIKMFTLFSGYDSQMMGLIDAVKNFKDRFSVELIGWSDINSLVQLVHNLAFPEYANRCYPDVSKINWSQVEDFDILFYSSPCQNASRAGRREGFEKGSGTESSLVWEVERAIASKRPKWLILENVEGYLDPRNDDDFKKWARTVASYGYVSYYKVLCAADFGIPQNRKRLIMVSMRIDNDEKTNFEWPKTKKLKIKPEDLLSDVVDDKYYLTVEEQNTYIDIIRNAKDGYVASVNNNIEYPSKLLTSQLTECISRFIYPLCSNGTIQTLMTTTGGTSLINMTGCRRERSACVIEVWRGDKHMVPAVLENAKPSNQTVKALRACSNRDKFLSVVDSLKEGQYMRIRRLTPEECLRFMGVEEMYLNRILRPCETLSKEGYTKEQIVKLMFINGRHRKTSDYSLYWRAGNSIVVQVLSAVFTAIIKQYPDSFGEFACMSPKE